MKYVEFLRISCPIISKQRGLSPLTRIMKISWRQQINRLYSSLRLWTSWWLWTEKLAEVVKGTIFADAGYLQKKDVLKRMEEDGIKFEAAPRKNMNRLMSRFECYHIKHRSIIESDWGTLKNNFQLEYHKARSIVSMFRHFFYSIAAYMINRNLDFYQNFFRLRLI